MSHVFVVKQLCPVLLQLFQQHRLWGYCIGEFLCAVSPHHSVVSLNTIKPH